MGTLSAGRFFESKVRRTLESHMMIRQGDHILVAVSGGVDSVALLHGMTGLAPRLQLRLTVAHLNHMLRGSESGLDATFVAGLARDLGWPYVDRTVDVRASAAARRANLEGEARRLRYEFLRETALAVGASKIAVGHTKDDQAETVLLRLLRGSGFTGLAAIRPSLDDTIIRPLIECTRREVTLYLQRRGVEWREDHTNADLSYRRNRIRHELIPYLEAHFNPGIREVLAREANLARAAAEYLAKEGRKVLERALTREPAGLSLGIKTLVEADPAIRCVALRLAFCEIAGAGSTLDSIRVAGLLALCEPGGSGRRRPLPGGFDAIREHDRLRIRRESAGSPAFGYDLPVPGRCCVPEAGLEITARRDRNPGGVGSSSNLVRLEVPADIDLLRIRSRRPGDAYGGPGHRKVKRILIDRKVPLSSRDAIPLVTAGDVVLWIPGFPTPRHLRPKSESREVLVLEARPLSER